MTIPFTFLIESDITMAESDVRCWESDVTGAESDVRHCESDVKYENPMLSAVIQCLIRKSNVAFYC